MKHLLFITTSSLASNPRLVKEFEFLKKTHRCTVVCFKHNDWSLKLSHQIKTNNPDVHFIEIDRKLSFFATIFCKTLHKLAIFINPLFQNNILISAYASNDKTPQLVCVLKQFRRKKIDIVIAHNLGAFFPAMQIANKLEAKLQLDIEDFYPGEALYYNKTYEKANRFRLMSTSFTEAVTIIHASKGIALECRKYFTQSEETKELIILNAFSSTDFIKPQPTKVDKVKCVWFSQNIGPNRGLEQVFETAKNLTHFEFHLIGNANHNYLSNFTLINNIVFHEIMPQAELHAFLSTMDIGLALERIDGDRNRDICLTNKILAYAQAGLFIVATDTFGQRQFLEQLNYKAGVLLTTSFFDEMSQLEMSALNYEQKLNRWQNAKSFSWEEEQKKLRTVI